MRGAAKEGRPPCVWDREQRWDAMPSAIHHWGEEHLVAFADGAFGCGGAGVGAEEGCPVTCGAQGWVLQVPSILGGGGNAVPEEKTDSSIGCVVLIKDDDHAETVHGFYNSALSAYHCKECNGFQWVASVPSGRVFEFCRAFLQNSQPV